MLWEVTCVRKITQPGVCAWAPALPVNNLEILGQPLVALGHGFLTFKRRNLGKKMSKLLPFLRREVAADRPLKYFRIVAKVSLNLIANKFQEDCWGGHKRWFWSSESTGRSRLPREARCFTIPHKLYGREGHYHSLHWDHRHKLGRSLRLPRLG